VDADVVGVGIAKEANGIDVVATQEKGFADAVHAVHDAAVAGEDDGIGEVARVDESGVIYDLSAGELHGAFVTPIGFVQLTNCGERYAFS